MPDWVQQQRREMGDRIRIRRTRLRLSQADLGERVGRDHKTIHRWETATTAMSVTDLLLVAHALDTPAAELVGEVGGLPPARG